MMRRSKWKTHPLLLIACFFVHHVRPEDLLSCPSRESSQVQVGPDEPDVSVGAILQLHDPGSGLFGCGSPNEEGLHYLETLRWAVDALNRESGMVAGVAVEESFIPGVKIGLKAFDSCGHNELAKRYMTKLFPIMNSGSLDCSEQGENASSVIGVLDQSGSMLDKRVVETAGRFVIPVVPLRQEATMPPDHLAKVLLEVVHDLDWEKVGVLHADDEYSIFVVKVLSQLSRQSQLCVQGMRALPKDDPSALTKTITSFAAKLTDKTGVIVIGNSETFKHVLRSLGASPNVFTRLQWLFSWMPPFDRLQAMGSILNGRQIYSLSPYPKMVSEFEEYWARLSDMASVYNASDRFFMEYVMEKKNCRIAGVRSSRESQSAVMCENLVVKETPTDSLTRTARFLPTLHSLHYFTRAYRNAWRVKCQNESGACPALRRMSRREFVEEFLEPLEFQHEPRHRSPAEMQGQRTAPGANGEVEGMQLALNAYSFSRTEGVTFTQVLTYDSQEAKVLDPTFQYTPSVCPKGGCKNCLSFRQSRLEDIEYIGMASSVDLLAANQSDDVTIPILLPIHKPGSNPLECSDEINPLAVQDLEAALWAVDQINRDTEFLPDIRLGVVVIDTCGTPVQITQKLSNYLLDTKKKDLDDFSSDLAFVAIGSPEEVAAASSIISPLNVTTISIDDSIRLKDMTNHHLQVAAPFEKKVKATVDALRYMGWSYVTVIHDSDQRSKVILDAFRAMAKESDICIAAELTAYGHDYQVMDDLVKDVLKAKKKGSKVIVMWTGEESTQAFLSAVHRAVLGGFISKGDLVIVANGDWIVNLQSFKEFENEVTGVVVLKTQQGDVEDFSTYYQRLKPISNLRNPWFGELWDQNKSCKRERCEDSPITYSPSTNTVNIIQGLLAISAGLARLRNELCHPEPGLCPKLLQTPDLREQLFNYIRETASSRLDAKGEMFAFTKQGYGNLPIEIFNFRRAAGKNFVYQKVGTYQTHLNNLAEIVMTNSNGEEVSIDKMTSECIEDCERCQRRPTDFVILDSKDHLYLATSIDIHESSTNPLTCDSTLSSAGLQTLEAFLWALDQINSSPHILPGVNLGAIVFDTCNSKEKAARDVANFFSSSISSVTPHKLPGVNQILSLIATQTDNVIRPIIDVAMPFDMMTLATRVTSTNFNDLEKYPYLLRSSLPNDIRAGALVDILKHFKWDYVSVLYSSDDSDIFQSFHRRAEEREMSFALIEKISPAFPKAAEQILINKLQEKRKEGARVVVLFLDENDSTSLFRTVKKELDSGRMEIGDFVWVTFDNIDAFHQNPLVSLGALMVQPESSTVLNFKHYFASLNPKNNSRNPWFRDYWVQAFGCRGSGCSNSHSSTPSKMTLMQDSVVTKLINSVMSVGVGLEALRQQLCPDMDRGLCPQMTSDPQVRQLLLNLTRDTAMPGADGKLFKFTNRGFSANNLEILNFRQVGNNAHAFVNVGTYSPDEGLSLNFSRIRTYNEMGKEISLYDIKSMCKNCKKESVDNFAASMQIPAKQDFSILVSLPVHSKGTTFFNCGDLKDERMFHHLSSVAYSIDKINRNTSLTNGVEIGTIVFDYCDRSQRGQDQLYSFFSKENSQNAGLRVKPKSVIAAMTFGTDLSKESSDLFDSMNVMQVATSVDRMDSDSTNDLLFTAPSTLSQIQVFISILKKFNWVYINVVYSNTDFGRAGYYRFSKEARESGLCLANVVIVEMDSTRESLLTNLQNGLIRDATVVVSLVDDGIVIQNMIEAIKISRVLSRYVWLGTETWGNDPRVQSHLLDATFDAITLKMEGRGIPEYNKFYENLSPYNHFPIPDVWFEEFWQQRFQCQLTNSRVPQKKYASVCTGKERLTSDELSQNEHIYQTVKTLESVAEGLQNYLNKNCPYGMAATNIDDCGKAARKDLKREIQGLLRDDYPGCEECQSSTTIFGYQVMQYSMANASNFRAQIGTWKDGLLAIDDTRVAFTAHSVPESQCSEDCDVCQYQLGPDHQGLRGKAQEPLLANMKTEWGLTVMTLSILGIVFVIVCAFYFLWSFPVTVGTTVLGYMILFGLLLLYMINFSFVLSPSEGTCGVRRFGLGLAYAIIFAGMLVKVMNTWRLMGYNGSRMLSDGTRLSSPAGLLVIAVGLVIIQVVLSSAWLILLPPLTAPHPGDGLPRCAPAAGFESGLLLSLLYCLLLLLATTLFAALTWRCHDNNRESRWILACALLVLTVLCGWAGLSTQLPAGFRDMATCACNLASATIIMACLYLRKVYLYNKLSRASRDGDMKARLQPASQPHSVYGSSARTFSTLAPVLYGSQASLSTKKLCVGPSSRVELIHCPEDSRSDSGSGGSGAQVQATDLYPLEMYDGGSQFQPVASLYGSNHTLILDDTLPFGR